MNYLKTQVVLIAGILSFSGYAQQPTELKVEYITNPIGIDVSRPLFSWKIETDLTKRNQRQKAYQIQVFNEREELVWDSKKVDLKG